MISINLTVHNKGFLIRKVLEAIKENSVLDYELIIVLDGCDDNSETEVNSFLYDFDRPFKTIWADNVFETKANNIAARNSEGDYIIIVQDDQIVNEKGWDKRLLKPFQFDDVFSVSANCAHDYKYRGGIDPLISINHANRHNTDRDTFAIRTTSNRGPLAIKHDDFERLGYFDEEFCPQTSDDHDLHFRAWRVLKKVTGLYWIDFISDLNWGGTRQPGAEKWIIPAIRKNEKKLWHRHSDIMHTYRPENRKL